MKITIMVATHKAYRMPDDPMYLPVHAGAAISEPIAGFTGDNTGENISGKNRTYCELTALYWGWKNLDSDYIGLAHYRRHFAAKAFGGKWDRILTSAEAEKILAGGKDAILPEKRRYFIETILSHYNHSHHFEDLEVTERVISSFFPDYKTAYEYVLNSRSAHMFNMCVMKREVLDAYCSWLFAVLEKVEEQLDISAYTDFDKRVFGRISEILMDVWIRKNDIKFAEVHEINMEGEHWPSKIALFLKRKIRGGRGR